MFTDHQFARLRRGAVHFQTFEFFGAVIRTDDDFVFRKVFVEGLLGFGHARLSIIDLSTGQQPMKSADGRYVIVFNGEIYNFTDLRKAMIYGSVLASFAVEAFSLERLRKLSMDEIKERYETFKLMSQFEVSM